MNAKDAMRQNTEFSHMLLRYYVDDLSDSDLLVRPVAGCNHIAWQLGHLISGTGKMLGWLGHQSPALPDGFPERHTKETANFDFPAKFYPKTQYLGLVDEMKAATIAAIEATPESALDQPGPPEMRDYAPTVASALMLLGGHWLMHAGQFVPIRRKLGKPPLF